MQANNLHPEILELFKKRRPQYLKRGLEKIQNACRYLDPNITETPAVIIGGTNGKGTTAGMVWRYLGLSGLKAGLFTSPHLISFNERIQITDEQVTHEHILENLKELKSNIPKKLYDELSFFEVTTLLALSTFKKSGTKINVLEVGLGGRLDSTNISRGIITAITSIGYDHQKTLGNTLLEIAYEKAGIIRKHTPFLLGNNYIRRLPHEVEAMFLDTTKAKQSPFWRGNEQFGLLNDETFFIKLPNHSPIELPFPNLLSNAPDFLKHNFTTATTIFYWICHESEFKKLINSNFETAFQHFSAPSGPWPPTFIGRFQFIDLKAEIPNASFKQIPALLDVCHNPDSAKVFVKSIQDIFAQSTLNGLKLPGFVSILPHKEVNEILDILKGIVQPLVLFKINDERTLTKDDLAEHHRDLPLFENFTQAWKAYLESAWLSPEMPVLVCGSVYAVGEVIENFGFETTKLRPKYRPASFSNQAHRPGLSNLLLSFPPTSCIR